jgi:pyridoxine kinase
MAAILSIQSGISYGHVGNAAAVLPLQRLGFEVWPIHTVQLGHHPGYGRFRGYRVEPERLSEILDAVIDKAPLACCVGLLAGYLGDPAIADLVLKALDDIETQRPDLTFLLDPVIGDDGSGVFVRPGVPEAIQTRLLPRADILTPNRFELALLSAVDVDDLDQALRAAEGLIAEGPDLVVATGLPDPDHPNALAMLAVSSRERWLLRTPKLARAFNGTGDTFSALMLGHYRLATDLRTGFERAGNAIYALAELTERRGEEELSLVAAQDLFARPEISFPALKI